jgi:ABC-2 type transport system permease protein
MRSLWHIARHDLRQYLSERSNIFFMLLMPVGFVFFFALVNAGGGGSDVRVSLPVVDRDGEFLSEAFVAQLRGERFVTPVYAAAAAETTVFDVRHIAIPDSFTHHVLSARRATVALHASARSNVDFDLASEVRLHQAQVRFLGNLLRWTAEMPAVRPGRGLEPDAIDATARQRFLDLIGEPSRVTIASSFAGTGRPVPRGTRQSIPGVLVMFVVMSVLIGGSESLTREKVQGTLRRLTTTPLSARQVLLGKTLGLTLLGLAQALVLVIITETLAQFGVAGLDFRWGPYLLAVAPVLVAFCACIAALGLVISGLLRTPQQAESLAWLFGMFISALGGAWWPLEIMPDAMRLFGQILPTSWAMAGLHGAITYGQGLAGAVTPTLVLLLMGALFWALGSRTLRVTG